MDRQKPLQFDAEAKRRQALEIGLTPATAAVVAAVYLHGRYRQIDEPGSPARYRSELTTNHRALASLAGISKGSAGNALAALERAGLIRRRATRRATAVIFSWYRFDRLHATTTGPPAADSPRPIAPNCAQLDPPRPIGRNAPYKESKKEPKQVKPPPLPSQQEAPNGHDWTKAAAALNLCGLKFSGGAIREAQTAGLSPADVAELCETYQANAGKFRGPGAIFCRIRYGNWPAEDVATPETVAAAREAAARLADVENQRREADALAGQQFRDDLRAGTVEPLATAHRRAMANT